MPRPDYAKEIAIRALARHSSRDDRELLTSIATFCIRELGYHVTSAELLAMIDGLRAQAEAA